MASNDLYQVTFEWPHANCTTVTVTGSFDHWSQSLRLARDASGFRGSTGVPWSEKIIYKFVVDGQWVVDDTKPTENDGSGNVNNVFTAPSKPLPVPELEDAKSSAPAQSDVPAEDKPMTSTLSSLLPQSASDAVKTVLAADGTSSALEYVATGVGAAVQTLTGVDPINPDKIPVQTPKTEEPETSAKVEPKISEATSAESVKVPEPSVEPLAAPVIPASTTAPVKETAPAPVEPSTHTPAVVPVTSPTVGTDEAPVGTSEVPATAAPEPATNDTAKADSEKPQPAAEVVSDSTKPTVTETKTNGTVSSSAPSTPSKYRRSVSAIFPRSESPSSDTSPNSSRFGSVSSVRRKRTSLFGKVKGIFVRDKDKEKSGLHQEVS
ncbi:hypothetical protein K435DRAFT_773855 [Dendrothele bispora CBS 962.96]|uniref:AMP-activated protein kinase glycogen-binding domain-containing protein n=1 Tax=Dendrothele bispora (strain CBS 962.96) TaxID=1314807 RepID=A0A4S8MQV6_DENBC|nr:hypothetical protein K435DRAFT_773855 [Dendrothele bispora CBS 962.96]